jgi:hypothetical protein
MVVGVQRDRLLGSHRVGARLTVSTGPVTQLRIKTSWRLVSAFATYSFHVKRAAAGAPKRLQAGKAAPVPDKVPRIARLLALAHKFRLRMAV